MTTFQRVSLAMSGMAAAVVLCLLANHWLKPRVFGTQSLEQSPSLHHAAATVVRVEHDTDVITVCFAIDSFAELPAADRRFYETTEEARTAGHGPRCVTSQSPAAQALTPGAKLDLEFTLANGGKIVIAQIVANGNPL